MMSLLTSIVPLGDKFSGKHGTGLVSLQEFTKIIEDAYMSEKLKYHARSVSFLDESIDFERDTHNGALIIHKSTSL